MPFVRCWRFPSIAQLAAEVLAMRRKLESSRSRHDLKRGSGGLSDLEFIVQYLQLLHAPGQPDLLRPNFWAQSRLCDEPGS